MRIKVISCLICVLIIVIVFPLKVSNNANADIIVIEEWVARYNGPVDNWDYVEAMALDSSGNVYVTGRSYGIGTDYDYTTVSYDVFGNMRWVTRYNGPRNSVDLVSDIAICSSGNIYVTGGSLGTGFYLDFATVAYDSLGNELWVARYSGPGDISDHARAMTVDASGNVYVTGESGLSSCGNGCDIATIAYDSFGNELWTARFNGAGNKCDHAQAIAVDPQGNVYVAGESYGIGSERDYLTVKYDSSGNELWIARYDSPVNGDDYITAISTDLLGNVYVTGMSQGTAESDYSTVAYDSSGTQLWVARYNGLGDYYDVPFAITTDSSGVVYLTGGSCGVGSDHDFTTVAYDLSGNELWVARYNGPGNGYDVARAISMDFQGNVYVTGESYSNETKEDFATIKYDSMGNEIWVARYDGSKNGRDIAADMAVDSFGNVYVAGSISNTTTYYDYATIKYSQQQIPQPTIDIGPNTLNLKSKGKWITCYISLTDDYDVKDIDISTILLEDTIPAEWGDIQGDILMVKFDRSEVEDMLSPGTYNLKVTGELLDGTKFEGYSDEIRVINPPKK